MFTNNETLNHELAKHILRLGDVIEGEDPKEPIFEDVNFFKDAVDQIV